MKKIDEWERRKRLMSEKDEKLNKLERRNRLNESGRWKRLNELERRKRLMSEKEEKDWWVRKTKNWIS